MTQDLSAVIPTKSVGWRTRVGVTRKLVKRAFEHKKELVGGFTAKYKVHDLIYYEIYETAIGAIAREKHLKRWSKVKKNSLIAKFNPNLKDLYSSIL